MHKIYKTAYITSLTPGILLGKGRGVEVKPIPKTMADTLLPHSPEFSDVTAQLKFIGNEESEDVNIYGNAILHQDDKHFLVEPL